MSYELVKKSEVQVAQTNNLDNLFEQLTVDDCVKFYQEDPHYDNARNMFEAFWKRKYGTKLPKGFVSYRQAKDEKGNSCKVLFITEDYP